MREDDETYKIRGRRKMQSSFKLLSPQTPPPPRLRKTFDRVVGRLYDVEQEAPHRVRCVYQWADKAHQGGEFDARHTQGEGGNKRYVELMPKITFEEFRDIQTDVFKFLDGFGEGVGESFKEELLMNQGTGRQNRELWWQCVGFFTACSALDYIVWAV